MAELGKPCSAGVVRMPNWDTTWYTSTVEAAQFPGNLGVAESPTLSAILKEKRSAQNFIEKGSRLSPEKSMKTFLTCVNSRIPASPRTRPKPESFIPPNGA